MKTGLNKASGIASTAMKVVGGAIAGSTAAMTAFGASAVKVGATFDSAMAQVAATSGKSMEQLNSEVVSVEGFTGTLRDFAQQMGSTTAFSATQSAEALNYMALAGYDATKSVEMLPKVMDLAAAGGMDLARASDMITDAQTALGLSIEETGQMVNKMATAAANSNTSVSQLGDAILTIGGTAKNLTGGTTELTTVLGKLADNGIKGAEAGTHLRNIMLAMNPTTDAAAAAWKQLGVDAYDANGNLRPLQDTFGDLSAAMQGMSSQERTQLIQDMFNKTDLASVNALLDTTADQWNKLSEAIDNSANSTAATDMAKTQLDNLSGAVTYFKSALEGVQIAISDQLSPTLTEFVNLGTDGLSRLTEAFKTDGISGAMEVLGEVADEALNKILEKFPQLQPFVDSFLKIKDAISSLVEALAPLVKDSFPVLIEMASSILSVCTDVVSAISPLIESLLPGLNSVLGFLTDHMDATLAVLSAVVAGFTAFQAVEFVIGFIEGFQAATEGLTIAQYALNLAMSLNPISLIVAAIAALVAAFIYLWNNCDEFREFWINLWENIKETFTNVWNAISGFFTETIPQAWENFKNTLKEGIDNIVEWFVSLPGRIQTFFDELPYKLGEMIGAMIAHIVNFTVNTYNSIVEFLTQLKNDAVEFFTTLPQRTVEFVTNLVAKAQDLKEKIKAKTKEMIDTVIEWVKTLPERIKEKLIEIANKVIEFKNNMIQKAKETARNFVTNLVDGIKELPQKFKEAAHNVVDGFINGIKEKIQNAKDVIGDFANGILAGFNNNLAIKSPSRKFKWSAEMCIAGFEKPFDNYDPYSALNNSIQANARTLQASFVGATGNTAGIDLSSIGGYVKSAIEGMAVMMDSKPVGALVAPTVNAQLGKIMQRGAYV